MTEFGIIILAIVLTLLSIASEIFIAYLIARETKDGLQVNHLLICLLLMLMFHGFISGVCIFFIIFKLTGVKKDTPKAPEKT